MSKLLNEPIRPTPKGARVADVIIAEMRKNGVCSLKMVHEDARELFAAIVEPIKELIPKEIRSIDALRFLVTVRMIEMN